MKKLSKIFIIIFIILFACSCIVYIDYYIVKSRHTTPKLAIKKQLNENLCVYSAPFYKVWYCKTNDTYTIGDYSDKDAICPCEYKFDEDNNYENSNGVKISKRDLMLISDNYTREMIDSIKNKYELDDAVYVSLNYGKTKYKVVMNNDVPLKAIDGNTIILFPEFKLNKDKYEWVYDNQEYYCMNSSGQVTPYLNNLCGTTYTDIKLDEKWCDLYTKSALIYDDDVKELCKK